jgi:hypothetical protein
MPRAGSPTNRRIATQRVCLRAHAAISTATISLSRETMMFHLKDGIVFERHGTGETYGGVRIAMLRQGEGMGPGAGETIVETDASGWASVVASMTAIGETSQTWGMILALQK